MANILKIPSRISSGSGEKNYKVIVASGYYSPPKDCLIKLHLLGGGGGGAKGTPNGGYRGGAGGYVSKTLRVKGGAAYNVTIGAGGTGSPGSPSNDGSAGGNTSFMGIDIDPIYAYGGGGGRQITNPSQQWAFYAVGGLGFGGDYLAQGSGGASINYHNQGGPFPGGNNYLSNYYYYVKQINNASYGSGGSAGSFVSISQPWSPLYPGYYSDGSGGQSGIVIVEEVL